jgi:hypothetical protein
MKISNRACGSKLFFSGVDDAGGRELWVVPLP